MTLTNDERKAVQLLGEVYHFIEDNIVAQGANWADDLAEIRLHIHAVQDAVLRNCAARDYPFEVRRLGADLLGGGEKHHVSATPRPAGVVDPTPGAVHP